MTDVLADKLTRIQDSPPIEPDAVDYEMVMKPDEFIRKFGRTFRYFARVEGEVSLNITQIKTLLHGVDDTTEQFLKVWEAQELPHGQIFEKAQRHYGLEPDNVATQSPMGKFKLGGELSRLPALRDTLLLVYLGRGAMHERMTAQGYRILQSKLQQSGAEGFVQTAVQPILKQEAGHLGYYKLAAGEVRKRLSPRLLRLARFINKATYAPVGVGTDNQAALFSGVLQDMGFENIEVLTEPVQKVSDALFGASREPDFVAQKIGTYALLDTEGL